MILQRNVTALRPTIPGPLCELAVLYAALPIVRPEFVFDDLDAIEPMLDVRTVHHQPGTVPAFCAPGNTLSDVYREVTR